MKRLATLLLLTPVLSGCALAALPVVTGGVLATRDVIRDSNDRSRNPSGDANVEVLGEQGQTAAGEGSSLAEVAPVAGKSDNPVSGTAPPLAGLANPYASLITYAAKAVPSGDSESDEALLSAVLTEPSALNGKRNVCAGKEPVLLIDIDPDEQPVSLDRPFAPNPSLATGLATLRKSDIEVAWISGVSASQAGKLRKALVDTGLDPEASDTLLLMRYKADRKQTRRAELAASNCIIAIAGGSRKDFDELYEYLLEPKSAFALETIINNGWFLTPNALTQD